MEEEVSFYNRHRIGGQNAEESKGTITSSNHMAVLSSASNGAGYLDTAEEVKRNIKLASSARTVNLNKMVSVARLETLDDIAAIDGGKSDR